MKDLMTMIEFRAKCAWEGGGLSEGFLYGLSACDLDDNEPEFKTMIAEAENHWKKFAKAEVEIIKKFGYFDDTCDPIV